MPTKQNLQELSDPELLLLIKRDPDYLSAVYHNTRDYCLRFMGQLVFNANVDEDELNDIYQDALIVLYENIKEGKFQLKATFQTYLNAVCRNLLYSRFGNLTEPVLEADLPSEKLQVDPEVHDMLQEIDIINESRFIALEMALEKMKAAGGNCYEILSLFWYHKKSMREIAGEFGYTNEANAKVQKAKCQKRLQKMVQKELNPQ